MSKEIIKTLKKTELFSKLPDKSLLNLAEKAVEVNLKRDGVLFMAGEEAKGLFVIAEGSIRGFKTAIDGREQVIFVERAPATIAEVPTFDDGAYFSTTCAEEETKLYLIEKNHIRAVCREQPEFALKALELMARRVRSCVALIESLALHEISERLVRFLFLEAHHRGERKRNGEIHLKLNLTRAQIAARIGTVREVVSRNLKRLEHENLIRFDKDILIIPNRQALKALAGEE